MSCHKKHPFLLSLLIFSLVMPLAQSQAQDQPEIIGETTLVASDQDRAGVWGVFGPGRGRINETSNDWHLRFTFHVAKKSEIKSIAFLHQQQGYPEEGWSTDSSQHFAKKLYPLVVFSAPMASIIEDSHGTLVVDDFGHQLNTEYDQSLGIYSEGDTYLDLYGQMENPDFGGGRLLVKLASGKVLTFDVKPRQELSCLIGENDKHSLAKELFALADQTVKLKVKMQTSVGKYKSQIKRIKKQLTALKKKKH